MRVRPAAQPQRSILVEHQTAKRPRRGKPREPLTDEELDAGQRYYGQANMETILKTFPVAVRKTIDPDDLANQLDRAARWYVEVSAALPADAVSKVQRRFERLVSHLRAAQRAIDDLPDRYLIELLYAADRLARQLGHLPDLEPDFHDFPPSDDTKHSEPIAIPVWPVEEQFKKALKNLTWLRQIAEDAAIRAEADKGPSGPRPDEPEHEFVRTLANIFKNMMNMEEIICPRFDPIEARWHNNRILRFVIVCQKPLGTAGTLKATLRLLERAGVFKRRLARRPPGTRAFETRHSIK